MVRTCITRHRGTQVHGCTTSPNRESHGPIHLSYSRSDLCIQLRFGDQYLDTPGLEIWRPSILRPLYPMNGLTPENYTLMKIQGPLTYDKGLYLDHCTTDNRHINYIALSYSLTVVRSVVFLVFFLDGGCLSLFQNLRWRRWGRWNVRSSVWQANAWQQKPLNLGKWSMDEPMDEPVDYFWLYLPLWKK